MVFAKLTRPKRRSQTLLFSRRAVVNLRDGRLCLQFRVADIRKTHMVDARLRAHLLHTRRTAEGERLDTHRTELKLTVDSVHGKLFLIWPLTAVRALRARQRWGLVFPPTMIACFWSLLAAY